MLKEKISTQNDVFTEDDLQALEASLIGRLIQPSDDDYDSARDKYNAMIGKHPHMFVRCESVADIIASVNFAREYELDLAIHGGGHNGAGLALVDNGLVIDLTPMKSIRVDPNANTDDIDHRFCL